MHHPLRSWFAPLLASAAVGLALAGQAGAQDYEVIEGADNNNLDNPFVQPQDPAEAGGGRNQTLNNGDVLEGSNSGEVIVGRLGIDILLAKGGSDVLIGGLEHFTDGDDGGDPPVPFPNRSDRAFGDDGADVFLWKPGDASDFFDGGEGVDAIAFGLVGEPDEDGEPEFAVVNDGQAGVVFIDPETGLPLIDVTNSPGFCPVIDASSSPEAADELEALGLDHLIQFVLRGVRDAFENGEQEEGAEDNGLRVTLHLKDVEYLVCASRDGGDIEVLDLTTSPPTPSSIDAVQNQRLQARLQDMVL